MSNTTSEIVEAIKRRVAIHSNNHRHYYELGKGVLNAFAYDLIGDFTGLGYKYIPLKIGDSVWYAIGNKIPQEYIIHFIGINENGIFFNCHKATTVYAHDRQFTEDKIGDWVFKSKREAAQAINERMKDDDRK